MRAERAAREQQIDSLVPPSSTVKDSWYISDLLIYEKKKKTKKIVDREKIQPKMYFPFKTAQKKKQYF